MIILYPRLANGNVLWTCNLCGNSDQITVFTTRRVSIYCTCNRKCNPACNKEYYNTGEYLKGTLDRSSIYYNE